MQCGWPLLHWSKQYTLVRILFCFSTSADEVSNIGNKKEKQYFIKLLQKHFLCLTSDDMRHKYANVQQLMGTNEDFLIEIKVQRPNMSTAKWTFDIDTVQITVSLCNLQSRLNIFPHQKWLIIGTQQARAHKHIKGGLSTSSFSERKCPFSGEFFLSFFL